jgi:hypothetical protein
MATVAPKAPDAQNPDRSGGHAQQMEEQQLRDDGNAAGDAEYQRRLIPSELRPGELPDLPELRVPLP